MEAGVGYKEYFFLMHKDDIVATLHIDMSTGVIDRIGKNVVPELLPLGGKKSMEDLKQWWKRRTVPLTRNGIAAALQLLKINNAERFLVLNLGLSLNDQYWIKPVDSELTWSAVNLYENDFTDSIGNYLFTHDERELDLTGKTKFVPSASTTGELKKKWIIDSSGQRCLVKGNYGISFQQSLNEVLATKIHRMQDKMPYTEYKITKLTTDTGESIGCSCINFTDMNKEFIPAIDINMSEKKRNDVSEFEHFINVCEKNGLSCEYVRDFLEYQILSDFYITNTDRHFNNFGVLRNPDTLEFTGLAPIYDSGNSMFWDKNRIPADLVNINVSSFKGTEIKLLSYVTKKDLFDISKVPSDEYVYELYSRDSSLTEERIHSLISVLHEKKDMLHDFAMGKNLAAEAEKVSAHKWGKGR